MISFAVSWIFFKRRASDTTTNEQFLASRWTCYWLPFLSGNTGHIVVGRIECISDANGLDPQMRHLLSVKSVPLGQAWFSVYTCQMTWNGVYQRSPFVTSCSTTWANSPVPRRWSLNCSHQSCITCLCRGNRMVTFTSYQTFLTGYLVLVRNMRTLAAATPAIYVLGGSTFCNKGGRGGQST